MFLDECRKYMPKENIPWSHRCVAFSIDNVFLYARDKYLTSGIEVSSARDYPNVAPLAPAAWMEWRTPFAHKADQFAGVEIQYEEMPDGGWCLNTASWGRRSDGTILRPHGIMRVLVDPQGLCSNEEVFIPLDLRWSRLLQGRAATQGVEEFLGRPVVRDLGQELPYEWKIAKTCLFMVMLATTFAHCKGARVEEVRPSRQVLRAAQRDGVPVVTHKTIDIRPATRVLRDDGDIEHNGMQHALHLCRGHFATYTAERPLFGNPKNVGTFYIPMHLRGSADRGVVEKDYRVHTATAVR